MQLVRTFEAFKMIFVNIYNIDINENIIAVVAFLIVIMQPMFAERWHETGLGLKLLSGLRSCFGKIVASCVHRKCMLTCHSLPFSYCEPVEKFVALYGNWNVELTTVSFLASYLMVRHRPKYWYSVHVVPAHWFITGQFSTRTRCSERGLSLSIENTFSHFRYLLSSSVSSVLCRWWVHKGRTSSICRLSTFRLLRKGSDRARAEYIPITTGGRYGAQTCKGTALSDVVIMMLNFRYRYSLKKMSTIYPSHTLGLLCTTALSTSFFFEYSGQTHL